MEGREGESSSLRTMAQRSRASQPTEQDCNKPREWNGLGQTSGRGTDADSHPITHPITRHECGWVQSLGTNTTDSTSTTTRDGHPICPIWTIWTIWTILVQVREGAREGERRDVTAKKKKARKRGTPKIDQKGERLSRPKPVSYPPTSNRPILWQESVSVDSFRWIPFCKSLSVDPFGWPLPPADCLVSAVEPVGASTDLGRASEVAPKQGLSNWVHTRLKSFIELASEREKASI